MTAFVKLLMVGMMLKMIKWFNDNYDNGRDDAGGNVDGYYVSMPIMIQHPVQYLSN